MKQLMICISIAVLSDSQLSSTMLFDANNLELDLINTKIDRLIEEGLGEKKIIVEKLALDGVHVARCATITTLPELKTLLAQLNSYAQGDFINLNRAIGAFDNSTILASEIVANVDKIAPTAYRVSDNYQNGNDIRDKENFKYVEVGKGILIGMPIKKQANA